MGPGHDGRAAGDVADGGPDGVFEMLGEDPQYAAPDDVTAYVLDYLKEGPAVRPWGDEDRIDTVVVCRLRYR